MAKVILETRKGISIEHWDKTLNDVLEVAEKGAKLTLLRYDMTPYGLKFIREGFIGWNNGTLTQEDYMDAYDQIF